MFKERITLTCVILELLQKEQIHEFINEVNIEVQPV